MSRKLRMGMVGGGRDALIGPLHRAAANANGMIELVAGAFSSTRTKSKESGQALGLPPERVYGVYRDMFRREAKLAVDERIDFIAIVTPSNMHYPITMAAIDAGFHVLCESPMTTTVDEAENLSRKLEQTGRIFCLTEHHAGYPMIAKARELVDSGRIGAIRRVVVEYPQGWLASRIEAKGQKQAAWRTNPRNTGNSCCMSDVGTHALSLATMISGLTLSEVCSDLATFVNGRMLEDDGSVLLRYAEGARGVLWASQIAIGAADCLNIRLYGETGTLVWREAAADTIVIHSLDGEPETFTDSEDTIADGQDEVIFPAGYPKGHLAPLATLYQRFAQTLLDTLDGNPPAPEDRGFPGVEDGIQAARFTAAVVASANGKEKWVPLSE
jgi:predicted dehydrogenase